MKVQCSRRDGLVKLIVSGARHCHRLLPGGSTLRGHRAELGPREVRDITTPLRIPANLVNYAADRMREVRRVRAVQGDLGYRVLARQWFPTGFEIDVFRKALKFVCTPLCGSGLVLQDLDLHGIGTLCLDIGEARNAADGKDRQPEHQQNAEMFLPGSAAGESAAPEHRPDPDLI